MSDLKRQMQIYTNGLWKDVHHTTAAEWPPELVRFAEPMRPEMPDPKNTFADHSYPAYSRAQMVQAMLDAVELYRRTQPEATAPAQDLSAAILALEHDCTGGEQAPIYIAGFNYAKQLAAALASSANALSAGDRVDAALGEAVAKIIKAMKQNAAPVDLRYALTHADSHGDQVSFDADILLSLLDAYEANK